MFGTFPHKKFRVIPTVIFPYILSRLQKKEEGFFVSWVHGAHGGGGGGGFYREESDR